MIVVDARILERNASGTLVSGFWLLFQGQPFPSEGWDDFSAVVLSALLDAVDRVILDGSETEFVHFMEGPFGVELGRGDTERELTISAVERTRAQKRVKHTESIQAITFVTDILKAARTLSRWSHERGWELDEVEALTQNALRLKQRLGGPASGEG